MHDEPGPEVLAITSGSSAELRQYAIGTMVPQQIAHPVDENDAAEVLLAARNAGQAVVPVGGATLLHIGSEPTSYTVAVATDHLTGIVEYNPADLTVVVRGGTTLEEVEAELRPHQQFLSIQAPFPERATIGGTLAANISGPLRLAYGSARDAVIGTRVALPSGQVAKSGGRVVKNVAGYDLSKLFIGSFGTLGIIVEAAFKVFPRPLANRMLVIPAADVSAATELAWTVARLGPGLLSLAVVNHRLARVMRLEGPSALALVGGTGEATEELAAEIGSAVRTPNIQMLLGSESNVLMQMLQDFPGGATVRLSARVPRPHVDAAASDQVEALSYPTIGTSFLRAEGWNPDDVMALRREATRYGGNVVVWRRSAALEDVSCWGDMGPELALMRSVKAVFDPHRIMSPGRFIGDI